MKQKPKVLILKTYRVKGRDGADGELVKAEGQMSVVIRFTLPTKLLKEKLNISAGFCQFCNTNYNLISKRLCSCNSNLIWKNLNFSNCSVLWFKY